MTSSGNRHRVSAVGPRLVRYDRRTSDRWRPDHVSTTVGTDDDRLQTFRRLRDQIAARLRVWLASRPW